MDIRAHYLQLIGKVDDFFGQVLERYDERMQCGPGCSDCCHSRFSVTLVEADHIAQGAASLDASTRLRLRERALSGDPSRCAALADDGMCEIHPWRPIICRSHGAPVYCPAPEAVGDDSSATEEQKSGDERVHLPIIEVCPKNFRSGFDDVDPRMVFDQDTVSTVLGAIDAAFADSCDSPRGTRIEIAEIMAHLPTSEE